MKELRSIGIQPDILLCRGKNEIDDRIKKKLALFTNVSKDAVFSAIDAETIYDIPVLLQKQNIDTYITKSLKLKNKKLNLKPWTYYRKKLNRCKSQDARLTAYGVLGEKLKLSLIQPLSVLP